MQTKTTFNKGMVESVLTTSITVCYGYSTAQDRKVLERAIKPDYTQAHTDIHIFICG